jgi:CDP-archaeol synthase
MLEYLLQVALIIFPVFMAGVLFIVTLKLGLLADWKIPLDGGRFFRGRRIFGDNKTLLGLLFFPCGAVLAYVSGIVLAQVGIFPSQSVLRYSFEGVPFIFGYGLAYTLGELPNSFFKRQRGVAPGARAKGNIEKKVFAFIDRADSIVACALYLVVFSSLEIQYIWGALILGIGVHFLTDTLMRAWKIKD